MPKADFIKPLKLIEENYEKKLHFNSYIITLFLGIYSLKAAEKSMFLQLKPNAANITSSSKIKNSKAPFLKEKDYVVIGVISSADFAVLMPVRYA